MRDPLVPTEDELWTWATDPAALEPMQDWDVVLSAHVDPNLAIELVVDSAAPDVFLRVLYLRVGDEVRAGRPSATTWDSVVRARSHRDRRIATWAERSLVLRSQPELFVYAEWCDGGLARDVERRWPSQA